MRKSPSTVLNGIAAAWLSIVVTIGTSHAQSISGTVYDPDGGVVAGARVMLMQDYVKMQETKSGETGAFGFADLKTGMYQVQIKQPRFSIFQQTVDLPPAEQARVYAVLSFARVVEEFQISTGRAAGAPNNRAAEHAIRAGGKVQPPRMLEVPRPGLSAVRSFRRTRRPGGFAGYNQARRQCGRCHRIAGCPPGAGAGGDSCIEKVPLSTCGTGRTLGREPTDGRVQLPVAVASRELAFKI